MKKYIYGAVLVTVVAAVAIFFFRPPETNPPRPSTVLAITFRFPEGYEFTAGAPFLLTWRTESPDGTLSVPVTDKNFKPFASPYRLTFTPPSGSVAVILNARLYYCHKASRMCFQDDFQTRVPLDLESTSTIPWVWDITPKQSTDRSPQTADGRP
jgi:hypothetical protein